MRYLVYSLVLFVFVIALFSCVDSKESKTQEQKEVVLMKANWSDSTAIAKSIDIFYKDSVLKKGKASLKVRDAFVKSHSPYQYLQLHKIYRPNFKVASSTVGYMPVLMLSGGDSAIVDFQVTWQQPNPSDSIGKFVVTETFLQTINNQPRYEWTQEDKYWIRKNVEPTTKVNKDLSDNKRKKMQ